MLKTYTLPLFSFLTLAAAALAPVIPARALAATDEMFSPTLLPRENSPAAENAPRTDAPNPELPAAATPQPPDSTASPAPASSPHPLSPEYRLGAGDVLKITIFNEPDLSGEFKVDGTGKIALPLAGNMAVGGQTLREVEKAIAAFYADGYLVDPSVSAEVLNYRPFYILGEVTNPGSYPYVEGMNVMNAIALAGGFTHRAKENEFLITRAADAAAGKIPFGPDAVILPGDIIEVQERFF